MSTIRGKTIAILLLSLLTVAVCVVLLFFFKGGQFEDSTSNKTGSPEVRATLASPTNRETPGAADKAGGRRNASLEGIARETVESRIDSLSPYTVTDLTPDEEERAQKVFLDERRMWTRLRSVVGEVEMSLYDEDRGETETLAGNIVIHVVTAPQQYVSQGRFPLTYQTAIKDKEKHWLFTSDGTESGTSLKCEDQSLVPTLSRLLTDQIVDILMIPVVTLSVVEDPGDDAVPGRFSQTEFFAKNRPFHNPDAGTAPDSFMFGDPFTRTSTALFERGHFSCWSKDWSRTETGRFYFKEYGDVGNGIWFPMTVIMQSKTQRETLRFRSLQQVIDHDQKG